MSKYGGAVRHLCVKSGTGIVYYSCSGRRRISREFMDAPYVTCLECANNQELEIDALRREFWEWVRPGRFK